MIISYFSSTGRRFEMNAAGNRPVKIKTANFHNWTYTVEATRLQYGEKPNQFRKAAVQYEVEIYVTGTKWEREAFARSLHEAASADLFNKKTGVLLWGEWRLECNIISSSTYPHPDMPGTTINKLIFYAPRPFWTMHEEFRLVKDPDQITDGLDFPFDFPFDFAAGRWNVFEIENHHYRESDFIWTVTGPAQSPRITVNGHPYQVYADIPMGTVMTVNSRERTVMIGGVNHFADRRKDYSLFQTIPAGHLTIVKSADFDTTLALKQERDEPTIWI